MAVCEEKVARRKGRWWWTWGDGCNQAPCCSSGSKETEDCTSVGGERVREEEGGRLCPTLEPLPSQKTTRGERVLGQTKQSHELH
jgi:hypothetical protein